MAKTAHFITFFRTDKTTDFVKIYGSKTVIYSPNMTKDEKMGAKTGFGDEVEDVIIQVLGHR